MTRRKRIHGHRRKRSPLKMPASQDMFSGIAASMKAFAQSRDKKGSAEATGRAEGEDPSAVSQKKSKYVQSRTQTRWAQTCNRTHRR